MRARDKAKEWATSVKFWITCAVLVVGTLGGLGYAFDRPVWLSELRAHEVAAGEVMDNLQQQTTINVENILEIKIDQMQLRIWDQEDRLEDYNTKDGWSRLRDLNQQLKRLIRERKDK
ncbi:hypothetical protein LCGC14_0231880 [marine sediment metagenome]|uniref:Uncharacterized protein n=1 Tax=marine sediment metagenome TaxID=412755 RepID=A0A0F9UA56_9ZZZZ